MTSGTHFHVGSVGLSSMGIGAARSCLRAGLPTWGTNLNQDTCARLASASNAGYGKEDDSAVIKIFSGINLPGVTPEEPSC